LALEHDPGSETYLQFYPNLIISPATPYPRNYLPFDNYLSPSKLLMENFIRFQMIKKVRRTHHDCCFSGNFLYFSDLLDPLALLINLVNRFCDGEER
jgi:hypothetical protein